MKLQHLVQEHLPSCKFAKAKRLCLNRLRMTSLLLAALCLTALASPKHCSAQERMRYPDQEAIGGILASDEISEAVLETERGRELVDQLRVLRTSESSMGQKHPLLPVIRSEIKKTKRLLGAWEAADELADESEAKQLASIMTKMEDQDLRQLVLKLILRMDDLEEQIADLKKKVQQ